MMGSVQALRSESCIFASFCDDCNAQIQKEQEARIAEEKRQEEVSRQARAAAESQKLAELQRVRHEAITNRITALHTQVADGQRLFLYETLYLPVDSVVLEENIAPGFDLGALRELGLAGWEVVGVVPRTIGVALTNKTTELLGTVSYGGGVGGNVLGVHLLLRKEMTRATPESFSRELAPFVDTHALF
jgi:multidrug efflux pump subunit AcrA (membrane-fusion protein)